MRLEGPIWSNQALSVSRGPDLVEIVTKGRLCGCTVDLTTIGQESDGGVRVMQ